MLHKNGYQNNKKKLPDVLDIVTASENCKNVSYGETKNPRQKGVIVMVTAT